MVLDFRMRAPIKESMSFPDHITGTYGEMYKESYVGEKKRSDMSWEDFVAEVLDAGITKAVLIAEDMGSTWGKKVPNEKIAEAVAKKPDLFVGMASVDPYRIVQACRELEVAVRELGLRGLCLWPCFQHLYANDKKYYPLYAKCVELNIPVSLHTSINFSPETLMDYGRPIHLDEIAHDFPDLKIVASHAGWPWVTELVGVAWRNKNVFIETSAMRPKYYGIPGSGYETLLHFGNSVLKDKVIFGSQWPLLPLKRTIEEIQALPLKDEVKKNWLYKNGARVLGLD